MAKKTDSATAIKAQADAPAAAYQTLQTELQTVVAELEDPSTDIDRAIILYEQATKLLAAMQERLDQAELRIEQIAGTDRHA